MAKSSASVVFLMAARTCCSRCTFGSPPSGRWSKRGCALRSAIFLLEKGIRFYAGAPLRTSSGFVLGSLCVIDIKPRSFGPKDRKFLQFIADELMSKVEAERRHTPIEGSARSPGSPDEPPALAAVGET